MNRSEKGARGMTGESFELKLTAVVTAEAAHPVRVLTVEERRHLGLPENEVTV